MGGESGATGSPQGLEACFFATVIDWLTLEMEVNSVGWRKRRELTTKEKEKNKLLKKKVAQK